MKRICLYLSLFVLIHSTATAQSLKQNHPRTDGFYLYDNGLDTIVTIPGGNQMQIDMINYMKQKGYIDSGAKANSYLDTVAKNSEGTTDIKFITFFNDTEGTYWSSIYRTKDVIKSYIKLVDERRKWKVLHDSDRIPRITNIEFENDSIFSFKRARGFYEFEQTFKCIVKGDTLKTSYVRTCAPWHEFPHYDCVFIPFNDIPADLLKIKK